MSPPPKAPYPSGPATNCKRVGWDSFFEGSPREPHPFPPSRRDLKAGYEEGWDEASRWKPWDHAPDGKSRHR